VAFLGELGRAIHFAQRDQAALVRSIEARHPPRKAELIAAATEALAHDQKKLDALGLLARVRADLERTAALNQAVLSSQREARYHDELDPAVELSVGILLGP
jgi:hypothetical protein